LVNSGLKILSALKNQVLRSSLFLSRQNKSIEQSYRRFERKSVEKHKNAHLINHNKIKQFYTII
jgi:hypothetical protein